jgi:hypothetical protein
MAEAPTAAPSTNGTPAPPDPTPGTGRRDELTEALYRKVAQGYEIESEDDTHAVVVMKGRRRWFGLANAPRARFELTLDDRGNAKSRRL